VWAILGPVQMRVLAGVGAWLVGVGAATASSLLAVSLLGQGIASNTSQQLTTAAVNNALAAEASETQAADPDTRDSSSPSPSAARSHQALSYQGPQGAGATPSASASRSRPASSPSAQATATASPTVLTSAGGTVVAECSAGSAYLVSWSPAPGYEVGLVVRGPTSSAEVAFNSAANRVTMMVSCSTGVPTVSSTVGGNGGNGGGGGGGGDE
jgi:hypothetical protein